MGFTLGELLSDPGFTCDVVVVGDADREVRWVHATETTDPTPYLRGGEVVLTEGLWLSDAQSADPYVERLHAAGIAAVGFGLMPANPELPPPLLEACARHGLCLFSIPEEVPYVDLTEVFFERLATEREADLAMSIERHARFLAVARAGGDAAALVEQLAAEVGVPAWVSTGHGQAVSGGAHVPSEQDRAVIASALARGARREPVTVEPWRVAPIAAGGMPPWFLAVRDHPQLRPAQLVAIEQAMPFLEMARSHAWSLSLGARERASELVELILAGEDQAVHVAARLATIGIDSRQQLAVVVCAGEEPALIVEDVEFVLRDRGLPSLTIERDEQVIAVAAWDGGAESLEDFVRTLRHHVESAVTIGVGSLADDCRSLRRSLIEARHACRAAAARRRGPDHASYADVGSHRLLLDLQDVDTLRAFSAALLDPIIEHDQRHGSELLTTLSRFLDLDCQWQTTADALYVHVNTLRHRLGRIERLTGRRLQSTDARVDFFLAVRAIERV
ncbi:MAG TPA: PucR family transcriptional regulator ligand-binding domain-containing protein [Solirubrobacteraceae bacterium]|jgi:sugar diacid utilization regulator|nr:PucR family transcriptional regulator ligand-binding domain-containing protein [Solirubrobacteraceae bacterium]